ncbi:uncharacterized protein FIBRA_08035 [Fibroporia radiculosa]|uniref:Cytochrome P450 n=1 Tax=Fibroporia radiculosa TaxID=599839 RepID=J4IC51_9APHY|nr:uncharacterized protein FIBRA_08035 [Fibroporia radiculosa]CCM05801.1 predicted protein [Fibroporia radiculosa]
MRCAFPPFSIPGLINPFNPGLRFYWKRRFHDFYEQFGSDTISVVPWLIGRPQINTVDLDVARQVVAGGAKAPWHKVDIPILDEWGKNLFTTENEVWQRHRKIIGPAFNNDMYSLVWERTIQLYHDMMKHEEWSDAETVRIPVVQTITSKLAFLVVSVCGFGIKTSWSDSRRISSSEMSISEALHVFTSLSPFRFTPHWMKLPFKTLRNMQTARRVLDVYTKTQVTERKALVRGQVAMKEEGDRDVFTLLVRANEINANSIQDKKLMMTDDELIGNVFLLLFAGHETTAHALAATFALLAIHPEVQEDIYQQIIEVVGSDRDPGFDEYHKLNKVLNAFYEASRMFPASYTLTRIATEDTALVIPSVVELKKETSVVVPKGTMVIVDVMGLENNPRYYTKPERFMPSRWEDVNQAGQVTSFSFGPRNCIGRRFATTEAVAFITMWLRDWKIEPLLNGNETQEQWRRRVIDAKISFTLGIQDAPLQLKRRTHL